MKTSNKPPLWILIDGTNAVHRDAYGCGVANAAATFGRRIEMMIERWQPAAVVAAFDPGGKTFRHTLHAGYKAGRKRLEGIDDALEAAKQECQSRNVAVFTEPEFEADDMIATLAGLARSDGCRVMMYSSDKDLHQLLVDGEVTQLVEIKKDRGSFACKWVTASDLLLKHLIGPKQWIDFKILVGDTSDNIEGVKTIGPQTASNLLRACRSLDEFFLRPFAAPLSDRQRAAVINAKPRVPLLRELCTLRPDVPLPELWREAI